MNTPVPLNPDPQPFYIIDFDRTLADSDKLLEVFLGIAGQYLTIPRAQIDAADADVKARGDSFDTATFVRDRLAEQNESGQWEKLEKQFIHESRALNMLLPGAIEILTYLEENHKRFGILTYGNPLWQHIKLTAAGFNHVPRIVMTTKQKGDLVSSWQRDDGMFDLPNEFGGGKATMIIMCDDKAVSFDGFPTLPSRGYWVLDYGNELPSQQGSIPSNVMRLPNLIDVLKQLPKV